MTEGVTTLTSKQYSEAIAFNRIREREIAKSMPKSEWKPLRVKPHPRQADIDAFMSMPSAYWRDNRTLYFGKLA